MSMVCQTAERKLSATWYITAMSSWARGNVMSKSSSKEKAQPPIARGVGPRGPTEVESTRDLRRTNNPGYLLRAATPDKPYDTWVYGEEEKC